MCDDVIEVSCMYAVMSGDTTYIINPAIFRRTGSYSGAVSGDHSPIRDELNQLMKPNSRIVVSFNFISYTPKTQSIPKDLPNFDSFISLAHLYPSTP